LLLTTLVANAHAQSPAAFFTGNDVYQWCEQSKSTALAYTAGLYDEAIHGLFVLETLRADPGSS